MHLYLHLEQIFRAALSVMAGALLSVAVTLAAAVAPVAAHAQSLTQLAQRVVDEHPRLRLLRSQLRAAQYDVDQVRAGTGLRISTFAEPGRTLYKDGPEANTGDMGVRARYPLYDWGKSAAEVGQAQARYEAARVRVDTETVSQWIRLSDSYIDVLRQSDATLVSESYAASLRALRSQVQEIVAVDKGRAVDLQQVDSRLQQAELQAMQRKAQRDVALIQLRTLANLPAVTVQPLESLAGNFPPSVGVALTRLDSHPALLEIMRQTNEAEQALRLAQAQEKPQFDVQATLSSRDAFLRFRPLQTAEVKIVSQWELFDGGSARARSSAASERLQGMAEQEKTVRRDLESEVGRLWSQQEEARSRGRLWQRQIAFTRQLRAAFWEQFRSGRRTILDLLSVENDIYQARLNETMDLHDLYFSEHRLFIQLGLASERWSADGTRVKMN